MEESRLGIPILFGYDVIHGFRTIYPISLGQACSWNPQLVEQACAVAAHGSTHVRGRLDFSPMIDVAKRRTLGTRCRGLWRRPLYQCCIPVSHLSKDTKVKTCPTAKRVACLKHYIGYGASEAGRDYVYTEISNQTLWDTYIPPYEAGVKPVPLL